MIRRFQSGAISFGLVLSVACAKSLDISNPNAASEPQVLTSAAGIQALAVGMQQNYAVSVLSALILDTGLSSRELAANSTFLGELTLEAGGTSLTGSDADMATILGGEMDVMLMAEHLIADTPQLPFDAGTSAGIVALGHLYKARVIGDLTVVFQEVPTATDPNGHALYHSRNDALNAAIAHLDSALVIVTATPPSALFNSSIKGSKLDLVNTIYALSARYNLFAGNYQAAITAANLVNPTVASYLTYDAVNLNPIYTNAVQTRVYAPRDSLGTPLGTLGDARLAFFLVGPPAPSNPNKYSVDHLTGFFSTQTSSIPAYVPGEIPLIRAEANVQLGNLAAAVQDINRVRTKTAAQDPVGLGANLPAYSGTVDVPSLLTEIYRQRAAELYLQALRLEDERRLGRPGPPTSTVERNCNYYPYPAQERLNNPNTPPDPSS